MLQSVSKYVITLRGPETEALAASTPASAGWLMPMLMHAATQCASMEVLPQPAGPVMTSGLVAEDSARYLYVCVCVVCCV